MSKWSIFALCIIVAITLWFFSNGSCPLQTIGLKSTPTTTMPTAVASKITAAQLKEKLDKHEKLTVIDVRTKEEYSSGRVPGSYLIPFDEIKNKAEELPHDKNEDIVVYCRSGRRSATAAETLLELGYTKVYDMGAISNWTYGLEK